PSHVQVIELLALVEDGRIGGVEILGLTVADDSAPEGDHSTAPILNREDQAAAEARNHGAVVAPDQQRGFHQRSLRYAKLAHGRNERITTTGRPTQTELTGGVLGERAPLEVATRVLTIRGLPQ